MSQTIQQEIDNFRFHFDSMYIGGIPRLLDESGAFLAFLSVLTAVDSLAGVWNPSAGSGERFKGFVATFFPAGLKGRADELWRFRNLMVHAFNPGPFALVCNQSRLHLVSGENGTWLNAEDFYAALVLASQEYFGCLSRDESLQANFARRVAQADGGAPETFLAVRGGR